MDDHFDFDAVVIGAGFSGLYMRSTGSATSWTEGPRLRGGRRRRRHLVLEPLPRRPVRLRELLLLATRSPRSSSRSGCGAASTPSSRRSCATSNTWPTASTCGATSSSSTRVTERGVRRGPRTAGRSAPTAGDVVTARFLVSAVGLPVGGQRPADTRARHVSRASGTTPAPGPTRASTSPASGSGLIGTGLDRDPGHPGHRRPGRPPHRLPAHAQLQRAGPELPDRRPSRWTRSRPTTREIRTQVPGVLRRLSATTPATSRRMEVTPEEREATYEQLWAEEGGFKFIYGVVQRSAHRSRAQRHRRRVHPQQDPRDRRRTRVVAETAGAQGLPVRHQAAADRHRLLRDVQPRQRDPRRPPARRRSRRSRPAGSAPAAADYDLDVIVFATGFDAMTGSAAARSTSAAGTAGRSRRKWEGGPRHLPRPPGRRLPQPVRHHRAGQPVGADQHAGGDRAARGVDRRLHRVPARARV